MENNFSILFIICLAGAVGACLRYSLYLICKKTMPTKWNYFGIAAANVIGSFLAAAAIFIALKNNQKTTFPHENFSLSDFAISPQNYLLTIIVVGFCAGLTTFSTWSLSIFEALENKKYSRAASIFILNILFSFIAVFIAYTLVFNLFQ